MQLSWTVRLPSERFHPYLSAVAISDRSRLLKKTVNPEIGAISTIELDRNHALIGRFFSTLLEAEKR